jgi:hypothetical protein
MYIYIYIYFRPFKIIRTLKKFGMRPNFEVRLRTVAHLALAKGHPYIAQCQLIN